MQRRKLSESEIQEHLLELNNWQVVESRLKKRFSFRDFAEALAFVNKAGEIAEKLDHHPDIFFGWGYAEFLITTHSEGGLTELDFLLAKEIDKLQN
ncbi:MAG: 4a-hydroxytetrahydrobiopterin dehydratase [Pyrinomonadaceae bacterium]|nr:4a-hydroxytetrahydrobiopterin dehydratase [Pyrinomonadaceae bacterium]MCX7639836.1 4a-hydroxytetrahydrobiopterin dehydratase [Pyrinomonadaceae bacterium]MDW8304008.1 4a-hydroxytetrahydrobiopterin dehydratase [Acidobacteriota bacterium]